MAFARKTLFIVGAGASFEVGLPIGNKLKEVIAKELNIKYANGYELISGNANIAASLREARNLGSIDDLQTAAWKISNAMPQAISIDNFLEAHQDDKRIELCGKLAIVSTILAAEKTSLIFWEPNDRLRDFSLSRLSPTWYIKLWQHLSEGVSKNNIENIFQNVEFIVFNYDRCLEIFLDYALQIYYALSPVESQKLVSNLFIFHPYGVVSPLPWQNADGVEFGNLRSGKSLLSMAVQIRTYTERTTDTQSMDKMHAAILRAQQLVFLGFGYNRQNIDLIRAQSQTNIGSIIGTALAISDSDNNYIARELRAAFPSASIVTPELKNLSCAGLFDQFSRTLTR